MKKLFILLIFGFLIVNLNAQKYIKWDSIRIPVIDTTKIHFGTETVQDYMAVVNFRMTGLDSSVIIHLGGSDAKLTSTLWDFHKFNCDSMPYTISRLKWVRTVNGISQNEKSFIITQKIGHLYLGFYLKNSGCTPETKWLKYQILYIKP